MKLSIVPNTNSDVISEFCDIVSFIALLAMYRLLVFSIELLDMSIIFNILRSWC